MMTHRNGDDLHEPGTGGKGFFSGVLIGGLVGAAVGLLVAPRSGEDTIALLRDKSTAIKNQVSQSAREARLRAENAAGELRSRAETVVGDTRMKAQEKKAQIERSVEAAQDAWRASGNSGTATREV
jgi:gas vesicle protein